MNRRLKAKIIEVAGTQCDFAILAGTRPDLVSRAVRRRWTPPPEIQKKWAEILDADPKELFLRA